MAASNPPTAAEAAAPPVVLRIALAPRHQRRIASLTAACLVLAGLDALETGSPTLGWISLTAGAAGLCTALAARGLGAFLRFGNVVNAVLFAAVAWHKFGAGKLLMPGLQVVAALALLALAIFDLPRPGVLLADGDGVAVRTSRFRRRAYRWGDVTACTVDGARLRLSVGAREVGVAMAAPPDAATQSALVDLWRGALEARPAVERGAPHA